MTRRIVYFFFNFIRKLVEKYEQADRDDALSRRDNLNGWSK